MQSFLRIAACLLLIGTAGAAADVSTPKTAGESNGKPASRVTVDHRSWHYTITGAGGALLAELFQSGSSIYVAKLAPEFGPKVDRHILRYARKVAPAARFDVGWLGNTKQAAGPAPRYVVRKKGIRTPVRHK